MHTNNSNSLKVKKIGLIISSLDVSKHELDFIESCSLEPLIDLRLVEIKKVSSEKFNIRKISWKIISMFEKIKFNFSPYANHLRRYNLQKKVSLQEIILYSMPLSQSGDLIKHNFNSLISFDFRFDFQEIQKSIRTDLIFFYKGLSVRPQNILVGFDEILESKSSSSFSIIKARKEDGNLEILLEGSFVSSLYFSSNQANIFERRNYYLLQLLNGSMSASDIHSQSKWLSINSLNKVLQEPSLKDQFSYLKRVLSTSLSLLYRLIIGQQITWKVFYSTDKWTELDFNNHDSLPNPRNGYLADPFVFNQEGRNIVFVERFDFKDKKGKIAAYEIGNFLPKNLGIVIEEDFHLSYPYIFKENNNTYLIPESSQNKDVRLYECESFPDKWKLKSIILKDVSAADSMILKSEEKWWLLTNLNSSNLTDHCSELFIFSSNDLLNGPWVPHAKNPIYLDPANARNGGIIIDEDIIYRVSQKQGYGIYGQNIQINKILELNDENYTEEIMSKNSGVNIRNTEQSHHLHTNSTYSVYDKWDSK
ncbi:hypothetical protein N9556_00400 [bacterium]|mgnify:CR=1 FL=1|jgi:hypothetical protein|nr:hypothetical protein [bacterium]|tara:strand:+ start:4083 stop:5687 length:1605 start_codon:yes stop_codon:yes gene_type:complete